MTRTARATYPRAALKDRSQSRSGMDKSLKKDGAGRGNWGKLGEVEYDDEYDEESYEAETENLDASETGSEASSTLELKRSVSDQKEVEAARAFRKRALSGTVDLSSIARTSVAVSGSPPKA
ncbi:MAG: hypothetical protein NXY57DRAFT_1027840 [Lentinula lateritia]|uniref:Hyaluronan/mRNA-binding protein domain-containing protein n=1 Tax=Lentinula lateritia TaxID=40482 RepID=A0ABQ8VMS6_9AGAR|nr:hypothetical protein EV359DRAFT_81632 [Lentinula novae-zelandiae]KAJ3926780.1 MAG: hypothetical protein NXY57DRAFT_1027840 [Lentinula lateritia]KAJ4497693.1 hypothetical protein C8R41DRAFT_865192 [Lentinula lateritia]